MAWIEGGTFLMGSDDAYPEEAPARPASVDGFWIDRHLVTNRDFDRFAQDTGVAYEDGLAYARWAGKELPTEAEWEFAARGGLEGATYAWGDEEVPGGRHMANTWQGEFPMTNELRDGWEWTSPVGTYPPNGFGLYDMTGNVWEWTLDGFGPQDVPIPRKVTKGGSFLCAPNYCHRYRPAARMAQPVDTSTCHLGFRCVVRAA